jgi:hypothetical protein
MIVPSVYKDKNLESKGFGMRSPHKCTKFYFINKKM